MSWNEEEGIGRLKCPDPQLIRPGLAFVNVSIRGVRNKGVFLQGETVEIEDRAVYDQLAAEPLWEEAQQETTNVSEEDGHRGEGAKDREEDPSKQVSGHHE